MFLHVRSFHLYKVKAHIMTRSLVTGGAGFIGSHLTQRLLDRGESVLVVDDLSTGRLENLLPFIEKYENFEFREGTITDEAFLCQAMEGIDTVYHLAAAVGENAGAQPARRRFLPPRTRRSGHSGGAVEISHGCGQIGKEQTATGSRPHSPQDTRDPGQSAGRSGRTAQHHRPASRHSCQAKTTAGRISTTTA